MLEYAVIVRTDSYAGNFERELCAHLTGQIGECEVGKSYVDPEISDVFDSMVTRKSDDNGCWRPVSLGGCEKTPDYSGQDVVIWFSERPSIEEINIIEERANTFMEKYTSEATWNKPFKIEGIDAVRILTTVSVKPIEL
jgi:hypothetical protein